MATSGFNDAALAKLTAKLDDKLSKVAPKSQPTQRQPASSTSKPANDQRSPDKKRKQSNDYAQGRASSASKRSRHEGQPENKATTKTQHRRRSPASTKRDQRPVADGSEPPMPKTDNVLLEEILALGGNKDDLDLVGDADSDDDAPAAASGNTDKNLHAELAQFAAALGFDKIEPTPDEEDTEYTQEDEHNEKQSESPHSGEEDAEIESEVDSSDDEGENGGVPVATPPVKPHKGKTVSTTTIPLWFAPFRGVMPLTLRAKMFEQRPDWHAVSLPSLPSSLSSDAATASSAIASLKAYASSLLQQDTAAYGKSQAASSNHRFMSTIMTSGTMSDKVSALTLAAQESPLHNIKTLENLLALASKRNRGQALAALAALVDLLGPGMILPSNRRLYTFTSQPGLLGTLEKKQMRSWTSGQSLPGKITEQHLISWAFEDWLKESYFKMIQALEVWCDDEIDYSRMKAVDMVYALLKDKPEQESNLLRLLVNKLGDRERKISSRASYLLLQLLNIHPAMKAVVIRGVEQDIIFRQGQDMRAKYTAINTLNQTILSSKEPDIADSLLKIYFGLFVSLLKTGALSELDGEPQVAPKPKSMKRRRGPPPPRRDKQADAQTTAAQDAASKLVSAILTGVNRAVPFSQADSST